MKYNNTEDIMKTLEEAPEAQKALLDNQSNLNKVADYCENKFSNVSLSSLSKRINIRDFFLSFLLKNLKFSHYKEVCM